MVSQVFLNQKKQILCGSDFSRKGTIDEPIVELVQFINDQNEFVTTSSCSGRVIVVVDGLEDGQNKKGCKWLFTSHTKLNEQDALQEIMSCDHDSVLKFEPFILHVQCCSIDAAKLMQNCAYSAGFRNSGIMLGRHNKVTVAVRGCHSLEVPLADKNELLVNEKYVKYLINKINIKMDENEKRTTRFFDALKKVFVPEKSDKT